MESQKKFSSSNYHHSLSDINKILETSSTAFINWKQTSFDKRSALFIAFANKLEGRKEECAALISKEMGKVIKQSRQEIEKCIATCYYYAENASTFLSLEVIETESSKSYISYEPLGPVLAIMPWNFPFWQVIRFAVPTLMAGNTAILKHASNVPECAKMIENLFLDAGFDSGVFQTLFLEGKNIDFIVKDWRIKAVTLTGSEEAGRAVAEAAGKALKKTVLELGGSDPFIILKDAELETTVETAVKARMINTGQSCIAAKRFIVVKEVAAKFIQDFTTTISKLKVGDPFDPLSDYGPLAKVDLAVTLNKQVINSINLGAKAILGGDWKKSDGAFFPATVLIDVKPGMPAYDEELFGPVASIIIVENEDEAVFVANDTKYGLGASIWTKDIERGEKLASKIDAGSVFINKMVASDPQLPFGGIKMSGYGRELSYLGLREFTNIKTLSIA